MIIRFRIGTWRFAFTVGRVVEVAGVNSWLGKDDHALFWDFDDMDLRETISSLTSVQRKYRLPEIHVINTGRPNSFIAMCFKRVHLTKAIEILAATRGEDLSHLRFGAFRKRYTLRLSAKCGRSLKRVAVIPSEVEPDCSIYDLKSMTLYETRPDHYKQKIIDIWTDGKTIRGVKRG